MRWLAPFVAALLWAAPALAASPTRDGSAATNNSGGGGTTITATVTTVASSGELVIFVTATTVGATPNTISSVAATGGTGTVGSFTRRGGVSGTNANNNGLDIEEWAAPYTTALSSKVITVTYNTAGAALTYSAVAAQGFTGVCAASPFDPHAVMTATGTTSSLSGTQTTTNADDMLVSVGGYEGGSTGATGNLQGSAASSIGTNSNTSGALDASVTALYRSVSASGSGSSSMTFGVGTGTMYMVADALTADCATATTVHRLLLLGVGQ